MNTLRSPSWRRSVGAAEGQYGKSQKPKKLTLPKSMSTEPNRKRNSFPLSPFEKIKLESDRKTAHGHPVILPSEYGEFGPVFDVIALFHNAVKRQAIVAYDMLESLTRHKYEVTHSEFTLFFDWFDTFEGVLLTLFEVEEKEVYPFLKEAGIRLPNELCADIRKNACADITASLLKITEKRDMFQYLPAGESVPKMYKLLDQFLNLIVQYYDLQSSSLPRLIFEADLDGDTELELRVRFITALRAKPNYATVIPFMTHWLTDRQLRTWKAKYLGPVVGLRFEQWAKRFEGTHQAIPEKLFETLGSPRDGGDENEASTPSRLLGRRRKSSV